MLILTRKSNESVIIGKDIEVKILGVRGDQVSLGFSAPKDISIYRKEVYETIQQENRQAASQSGEHIKALAESIGEHFSQNE